MNENIQKDYYDSFYKKNMKSPTRDGGVFTNQLLDSLDLNDKNILEIGCGDGYLTALLLAKSKRTLIKALDISVEAINKMKVDFSKEIKENRLTLVCGDLVDFLKTDDAKYDLIIGSGVLRHINKDHWNDFFSSANGRLNTRGLIVFSPEPNATSFLSVFWKLAGFFYNNIYKINYDNEAEKGTFDMKIPAIRKSIKSAGFRHFEIVSYKFFPEFGFKIMVFINKIVNPILPTRFAAYTTIKAFKD